MSKFTPDIIERMVAKAYYLPHRMINAVELYDPVTEECYYFEYDEGGITPMLAARQAKVDLSHQWRPQ